MKGQLIYLLLALITGALVPIQASTNAAYSKNIGSAFVTGLMVFAVGLAGMLIFILLSGTVLPERRLLFAAPLYSYLGGIIVAVYVLMITILVPRIGVGTSIGLIVTGQIIAAVIIDHFGLFGLHTFPINISRSVGLILMVAGVYFVMKR